MYPQFHENCVLGKRYFIRRQFWLCMDLLFRSNAMALRAYVVVPNLRRGLQRKHIDPIANTIVWQFPLAVTFSVYNSLGDKFMHIYNQTQHNIKFWHNRNSLTFTKYNSTSGWCIFSRNTSVPGHKTSNGLTLPCETTIKVKIVLLCNRYYLHHVSHTITLSISGVPRGGLRVQPPPPTPEIPKALQNRAKLNPIVKIIKHCWI